MVYTIKQANLTKDEQHALIRAAQDLPMSADEASEVLTLLRTHEEWQRRFDPKPERLGELSRSLLVRSVGGLVKSIAMRSSPNRQMHDDLIAAGFEGVLRAIVKFKLGAGRSFSSYCYLLVTRYVENCKSQLEGAAVIPSQTKHAHKEALKEATLTVREAENYDLEPADSDEAGGYPERAVELAIASVSPTVRDMVQALYPKRIDAPVEDGQSFDIPDVRLTPDTAVIEALDFEEQLNALNAALASGLLTERELDVLDYRYFGGFNETETANYLGIARSGVQKAEARAMRKLRESLGADVRSLELVGDTA